MERKLKERIFIATEALLHVHDIIPSRLVRRKSGADLVSALLAQAGRFISELGCNRAAPRQHETIAIAYAILALTNLLDTREKEFYCSRLGNCLLKMRDQLGLFHFEFDDAPSAPATFLSTLALQNTYEVSKKEEFREAVSLATQSACRHLYLPNHGFIHDARSPYWCSNVNCLAAYVLCRTGSSSLSAYEATATDSLLKAQTESGLFPYSARLPGAYYLGYQALILCFLTWMNAIKPSQEVEDSIRRGSSYLFKHVRRGVAIEPDTHTNMTAFSQMWSMLACSLLGDNACSDSLETTLGQFVTGRTIYAFSNGSWAWTPISRTPFVSSYVAQALYVLSEKRKHNGQVLHFLL